jgi:hypothetical protein
MTPNDAVRPVAWRGLWDSQWVNIVNHDRCYRGWENEDAINHAVKLTETTLKENNAPSIAHLQARVEALTGEVERLQSCIDLVHESWGNYGPQKELVARAESAERRVAELVEAARAFLAASDAYDSAETSSLYPDHQRLLSQYKWSRQEFEDSLTQPEADHG